MRLLSGSVTFANGDGPRTSPPTAWDGEPAPGNCALFGLSSAVYQSEFVNGMGPTLWCNTGHGYVYVGFPDVTDPRAFDVGTRPIRTVIEVTECDGSDCTSCTPAEREVANLTVEEAKGGRAPYPKLATADLERTFTIDIALPSGPAYAPTGRRQCTREVSFQAKLRFEQTAADWSYDPNGPCMCE